MFKLYCELEILHNYAKETPQTNHKGVQKMEVTHD